MKLFSSRRIDLLRFFPSLLPLLVGRFYLLRSLSSLSSFLVLLGIVWALGIMSMQEARAQQPLSVSGFWPGSGPTDTPVYVFGSGFDSTPGATKVFVNNIPAPIMQVLSEDLLFFLTPSGDTNGLITVTARGITKTSASPFGVTSTGVSISGFWQSGCSNVVYVFGSHFEPPLTLQLNEQPVPIVQTLDPGMLFFLVPNTATTGRIKVTSGGLTATSSTDFTIKLPPPISLVRSTLDYSKSNGTATLNGSADSVDPCALVEITKNLQLPPYSVTADSTGRFGPLTFAALPSDKLSIVVKNRYGQASTVTDQVGITQPVSTALTVLEDPAEYGNYPVGTLELDDEMAFPNLVKLDSSGKTLDGSLAWARVMYPATTGTAWTPGKPVLNAAMANLESSNGPGFPVVVFIHANNQTCNYSDPANLTTPAICYPNPPDTSAPEDRALRIPNHEGFNYLMERLASHGMFVISVNKMRMSMFDSNVLPYAQARLVMEFLDMLREWNTSGIQNKTDPSDNNRFPFVDFSCYSNGPCPNQINPGMFVGKLDLNRVGLSGHSRGGEAVVDAWALNSKRPDGQRFTISAINNIAPGSPSADIFQDAPLSVPFSLILGSRDGDIAFFPTESFNSYELSNPQPSTSPKMFQYVYGANHKFFNTITTEDRDLACGTTGARPQPDCICTPTVVTNCIPVADAIWTEQANPWVGVRDDATSRMSIADGGGRISAYQQRLAAVRAVVPFFRWHLRDKPAYKEMFTGENRFSGLDNRRVYYTYQEGNRKVVDGFEYYQSKTTNSLSGAINANGFDFFEELFSYELLIRGGPNDRGLSGVFPLSFEAVLGWSGPATYSTALPVAPVNHTDISSYRYLSFRVAESIKLADWTTGPPVPPAPRLNLFLSLVDGSNIQSRELRTDQYGFIPPPFTKLGDKFTVLSGIRIPLEHFTLNGANINLSDIRKIVFRMEGSGYVAIDDIELGN